MPDTPILVDAAEGFPLWHVANPPPQSWGQCLGQIVAAPNELEARQLASANAYGEGRDAWLSADRTTCLQITPSSVYATPRVVLSKEAD